MWVGGRAGGARRSGSEQAAENNRHQRTCGGVGGGLAACSTVLPSDEECHLVLFFPRLPLFFWFFSLHILICLFLLQHTDVQHFLFTFYQCHESNPPPPHPTAVDHRLSTDTTKQCFGSSSIAFQQSIHH